MNVLNYQLLLLPFFLFGWSNNKNATKTANNSILTLTASKKAANKGDNVCIDVIAQDFDRIVSMQYTMKWDKKVLKYTGVQNFKVPAMGQANFGERIVDEGKLTFSWYDPSVRGVSLGNGTSIYQVCFDVVGESGTKGFIQFTDFPTVTEITNLEGAFLDLNWTSGKVTVK